MRKLIIAFVFVLSAGVTANAQELGLRFGGFNGNGGVAIDGVFALGEFSRIHADVAFADGVYIDALWNFLYRPLGGESFNWYLGVGPSVALANDEFYLSVPFEAGLEYQFNTIPLSLSVDYRPALALIPNTDFWSGGFGLNVRYRFGG